MDSDDPPATPGTDLLRVRTPENVGIGYATAGVGSRLVAQLIDNLLALLAVLVVVTIYLGAAVGSRPITPLAVAGAAGTVFFTYIGYFGISELATGGSTLGKSVLGLRVIRTDGGAARATELVVRNVLRIVDVGLAGAGLVVAFFHPTSRRLGDLAAGTVVVRTRPAVNLASATQPAPVLLRTPDAGPDVEGISRLGDHEYAVLRLFLSRTSLGDEHRERLAREMAPRLLDRMGLGPSAPERRWPAQLLLERLYLQLARRRP